jgi:hypothetical protein
MLGDRFLSLNEGSQSERLEPPVQPRGMLRCTSAMRVAS